jgi:hypothetical protein
MQLTSEDDMQIINKNEAIKDVLVTDYLRYYVKSLSGNNMFEYVFPPYSSDTREFIVRIDQVSEATSYLESAKGELARNMSQQTIDEVFENPEEALIEAKNPAWQPFYRAISIQPTALKQKQYSDDNNKRTRYLVSDKRNPSREPLKPSPYTSTNNQKPMNYLTAVTITPTSQTTYQQPSTTPITHTLAKPTVVPLKGLGGGISPDLEKLLQMERDFVKLKNSFENTNKTVANLEQNMICQLKDIDTKIENSVATLLTKVEEKIDSNNELIQGQFSDIMTTKLHMHNVENNDAFKESNRSLLADMKEFFTDRFDRIDTSANSANTAIANLQARARKNF